MHRKLFSCKMAGMLAASLILFVAVGHADETKPDALADMVVVEGRGIGGVSGVAQTAEGTLITGFTYDMPGGWAVFLDRDGKEVWSYAESNRDCRYRRPTALPGGGFAVIREDTDDYLSLVVFGSDGRVVGARPLPSLTRDIVAAGDGIYACGNLRMMDEDGYEVEGMPFLARYGRDAEPIWCLKYPHEYELRRFSKAVYAMDSLIVSADTNLDDEAFDSWRGSLLRMDLDGNVLWNAVFDPELVDETHITDVCVSEDGIIAAIVSDWAYNEDYGYNIDRLSSVIALSMDGKILWKHSLNNGVSDASLLFRDGVMAERIVPVSGGFLCVGSMMIRECSGILPLEWVCLLDWDGNVVVKDATPDIRDDRVQIDGLACGTGGRVLVYGANIEGLELQEGWEEGDLPGKPFCAVLKLSLRNESL